jgi:hypothetical protein
MSTKNSCARHETALAPTYACMNDKPTMRQRVNKVQLLMHTKGYVYDSQKMMDPRSMNVMFFEC